MDECHGCRISGRHPYKNRFAQYKIRWGNCGDSFFVINFVIDRIYIILGQLFDLAPISGWGGIGLFDYVFYIVMTVLVYLLVGWIADRKLSI